MNSTFDPLAMPTRPPLARGLVWEPGEAWTYAHHPHLVHFAGRFLAIWSNGRRDEDAAGQRVLYSTSPDGLAWSPARVLAEPGRATDGREAVLTAAGLHHHDGLLVAYVASYGEGCTGTTLLALTTRDGETWSAPRDLGLPVCPNHGPQPTRSGRLIIAGNTAFPWTDDPHGLDGWRMAGIHPPGRPDFHDDPASFWRVREWQGWPVALCEGAFLQTPDGVLHMLLRSCGQGARGRLWTSTSSDDGVSWSAPAESGCSDCDSKFHLGRLPDGRFWYVGSPDPRPGRGRAALVLSLSRDGGTFDVHHLLADEHRPMLAEGRYKGGEYAYPHAIIHDGSLHVIVSRQKEAIEALRVPLASLHS